MSRYDWPSGQGYMPQNASENESIYSGHPYSSRTDWRDLVQTRLNSQGHRPISYRDFNSNLSVHLGTAGQTQHQHPPDSGPIAGPSNPMYNPHIQYPRHDNMFGGPPHDPGGHFQLQSQNDAALPHAYPQSPNRPLVTTTRRTSQGTIPFSYHTSTTIDTGTTSSAGVMEKHNPLGEERKLHADYRRRKTPRRFFTFGKVFKTLWSEPAGDSIASAPSAHSMPSAYSAAPADSAVSDGRFGEQVFTKIRRFVVIREGTESCTAVPINTYRQQGVARRGIRKCEHAIIYSGKKAPLPLPSELPERNEDGLLPQAIRVDLDQADEKLDVESRIDFGKVYTIEHKAKVKSLGKVNRDSEQAFVYQFEVVWARTMRAHPSTPVSPPLSHTLSSIPEAIGAHQVLDWAQAFALLVQSGWPEDRARAVLREDPRRQETATSKPQTTEDPTAGLVTTGDPEEAAQTENASSLPIRLSKEELDSSAVHQSINPGHAKKDSVVS